VTEEATCPACGGPLRAWRRAPDHEPGAQTTHLLLRCPACGTAVTAGDPPAFADAHEAGAYAPGAPRGSRAAAPILRAFDHRRLGLLDGARSPLLDVGAGRGRFVAYAREHGWDARGIEPSGRSSAPNVDAVALEDAVVEPGSVGAITLWHVLEHVEDPAAALARLHGWLRPGGTLLVGVPNLDSLQARIAGPHWYHLDLPRHRTHFTATGVQRLLERTGFRVQDTEHVLLEHNPFGLWQSALNRVTPTPSWLFHALKRNARVRAADAVPTALALPLVPVALAGEALAGLAGRGGSVAVRASRLS
jgi:predicted SAM-dependent methyltransferase